VLQWIIGRSLLTLIYSTFLFNPIIERYHYSFMTHRKAVYIKALEKRFLMRFIRFRLKYKKKFISNKQHPIFLFLSLSANFFSVAGFFLRIHIPQHEGKHSFHYMMAVRVKFDGFLRNHSLPVQQKSEFLLLKKLFLCRAKLHRFYFALYTTKTFRWNSFFVSCHTKFSRPFCNVQSVMLLDMSFEKKCPV